MNVENARPICKWGAEAKERQNGQCDQRQHDIGARQIAADLTAIVTAVR